MNPLEALEHAATVPASSPSVGRSLKTPETSCLFTRWINPVSGVESLILTERLAPAQQSFYFTHPSFTEDGRFLWLTCGYPPKGGRHSQHVLGVVDFLHDEMRVFPETQFPSSDPMVDEKTGEVYWGNHLDIYKRGPLPGDEAVLVNSFPQELAVGRLERIATHVTFSADRQALNIDARFVLPDGRRVIYIGELPLDGSPFRLWQRIEGMFLDHGLFSPAEPDVQLLAYEYWQDHAQEPFRPEQPYHRMWRIRRGEEARPILKHPVSHSGHEWWDPDGSHVWYVHYGVGIKKVEVETGLEKMKWAGAFSHADVDQTERFLVADKMDHPRNPDCHVVLRDLLSGREVEIVNRPPLDPGLTQCVHLHPHPQFCLQDRYICHTTTVHDRVDVALVPVNQFM